MDRRDFFKIVTTASAGAVSGGCGKKTDALIPLLVPDHEIPPGEEQWHPGVCNECGAGCGTIVRLMEGEHIIERNGEKVRERIACVKKIEGNPLDPVSGGRLCARGHATLQALYHPDRLQGPLRRKGERGRAEFAPASWEEAIAAVGEKLANVHTDDPGKILFVTSGQPGTRALTIQRFLDALGAPAAVACAIADFAAEREAAQLVFCWKGIPLYDLGRARYALGVGADFLGGWASPVYYARQFGHFRQGRPDVRGRLVQAESRMSITAASADQWLPIRPGAEPHLIIAIARLLLEEKLARGWAQVPGPTQESIVMADLSALIRATGIEEKRLRRIARELGESEGPLVVSGASIVHTNSVDALVAGHYLNVMLDNVGRPGGLLPPAPPAVERAKNRNVVEALQQARIVLLDGANPVYSLPASSRVSDLLAGKELVASFSNFVDDSAAFADWMLPDHHLLESTAVLVPAVSAGRAVAMITPFVRPLYNTQPVEQTLGDLARKIGASFESATPKSLVDPMLPEGLSFEEAARRGGLWLQPGKETGGAKARAAKLTWSDPLFVGSRDRFPLQFQPYISLQFHEGGGANLPWMQELPDPVSSAMWGLPVEIDPRTAEKLGVWTGDWVSVESPHGRLEAAVYVHPAAVPGVVSMAVGGGHTHYGRYASGRGANPLAILAPVWEKHTSALAFGGTRVRLARVSNRAKLIQFSSQDREHGPWGYR
jgi:anaerobic selenocysteine-containing dehydrogenase